MPPLVGPFRRSRDYSSQKMLSERNLVDLTIQTTITSEAVQAARSLP
jgi:hypothetical protein